MSSSYLGAYRFSKLPVTVYHCLARSNGSVPPLFVLIPGNPGIVDFYVSFLDSIHKEMGYETLCISHAGHDSSSLDPNSLTFLNTLKSLWRGTLPIYNLDQQITSKVEIIDNYAKYPNGNVNEKARDSKREVIVMGHSVGAYVAMRSVAQLKNCDVKLVGLLFPTIVDIAKSDSGAKLTQILRYLPNFNTIIAWFSVLLWMLPTVLYDWLVRIVVSPKPQYQTSVIKSLTKLVKKPLIVQQALGLAAFEMREINKDEEKNDLFFKLFETWTFFAQKDHWVSDETRDYIRNRYYRDNSDRFIVCSGETDEQKFKHSFVINQAPEFAQIVVQTMKKLI